MPMSHKFCLPFKAVSSYSIELEGMQNIRPSLTVPDQNFLEI